MALPDWHWQLLRRPFEAAMFHPMMRWAVGSRLQRRRIVACSILLAVLACAALPGVSQASRKIRGYGFTTIVPTKWNTGKSKNGTTRVYGAAPRGVKANDTVNAMHLGITVVPVKDFERQLGRRLPSSLEQLLGAVFSAPQQAQNVSVTAPFRTTTLGGIPAASGAATFFINGATVLQSETVSVRRGQVYIVTFFQDTALQYGALQVLQRIHRHWHWR
jgi:hypothetical protein